MKPIHTKKEWRHYLSHLRRSLSHGQRQQASNDACVHLKSCITPSPMLTVAVYAAIQDEIDPGHFVEECWVAGCRVVFPVTHFKGGQCHLTFGAATDWNTLRITRRGIREPTNENWVLASEIDVFVIPGLGFDVQGTRLGYGAGCYDRFLSAPDVRGLRIGFGYLATVVEQLPQEAHDQKMHWIVTEGGRFQVNSGQSE